MVQLNLRDVGDERTASVEYEVWWKQRVRGGQDAKGGKGEITSSPRFLLRLPLLRIRPPLGRHRSFIFKSKSVRSSLFLKSLGPTCAGCETATFVASNMGHGLRGARKAASERRAGRHCYPQASPEGTTAQPTQDQFGFSKNILGLI